MTVSYDVCAVDLGADPDGPSARTVLGSCVSEQAARKAIRWLNRTGEYEDSFLFVCSVTTVTARKRLAVA